MTPLAKLSRGILERLGGVYYEGPDPPGRLGEMAVEFANLHPHATRAEWVRFASLHAGECYRSGYVRGRESAERDYRGPEVEPERVADDLDPDWRWKPGIELGGDPEGVVMEANDDEDLARQERERYLRGVDARNRSRNP